MSTPPPDPSSNSEPFLEEIRRQFLAAWKAGVDGSPPSLEPFLAPFTEPKRAIVRAALEEVQRDNFCPDTPKNLNDLIAKVTKSDGTAETKEDLLAHKGELSASPVERFEHVSTRSDAVDPVPAVDSSIDPATEPNTITGQFRIAQGNIEDFASGFEETRELISTQNQTKDELQSDKPEAQTIPKTIAGYEVVKVLGRGAMGVVYKARQRGLKRFVALKMILAGEHASEQDMTRFRVEANAVAQLQHPGIVQIYEIGEDEGRPFLSLEFVDGPSLHNKIQGVPLPSREAASLLLKLAESMHYAHQRGVIHRDLKPANVLLTGEGEPKIGDFGVAKQLDDENSGLTQSGTVLGTPSYMSPEQASGLLDEVGPLADVYSLGAILYDMLTGRPPFRGTSVLDTLQQLRTREPAPPIQLQPDIPRDLETICLKCLEKDRNKRYADANALADDVRRFLKGEPILARPIGNIERLWRWSKRNKFKASTYAASILMLFAFIVGILVANRRLSEQTMKAEEAKADAINARFESDKNAEEAKYQAGVAQQKKEEAEKQTQIALKKTEMQRLTAAAAIKEYMGMIKLVHDVMSNKRLSVTASPEVQKVRSDLLANLRKSLVVVGQRLQSAASDTYSDLLTAQLLGDMLMKMGHSEEPRQLFEVALKSIQERVQKEPNNDRARGNMGIIEQRLGDVALDMDSDAHKALTHYTNAWKLHENIRLQPKSGEFKALEIKIAVAHDDIRLGRALVALGRSAEAKAHFQAGLTYFSEWLDSAPENRTNEPNSYIQQARMWLGIAAANRNDIEESEEQFNQALSMGRHLLKVSPLDLSYRVDQADVQGACGDASLRLDKLDEARKLYLESLDTLKEVNSKSPDDSSNQPLLALTYERLGIVFSLLNKEQESAQYFKEAAQLRKELWEIERSNLSRQIGFVLALARSGAYADAVRLGNTIRPRMVKSTELMLQVARTFAVCARKDTPERRKNIEQALSALAEATGTDYKDATVLLTDPDLSAIREEPQFKELIARIRTR